MNFGWGRLIAQSLRDRARLGKVLIVAADTNVNWEELNEIFAPTDKIRVLTTLSLALTEATASQDDVIFIAPYHTENITAAAGIAMSKAGVSVVGLGQGTSRPTFTWTTAAAASWDVSAADCTLENLKFDLTGFDAITAGFNITAANCHFKKCEFVTAAATNQAVLGILTTNAADGLLIEDCYSKGTQTGGTTTAIRIVGGSDHVIQRNTIIGNFTTTIGAIENVTTACDRTVVRDNVIFNQTAASTKAMVFVSTATAIVAGNLMNIKSGAKPITGANVNVIGSNFVSVTRGSSVLVGNVQYIQSANF